MLQNKIRNYDLLSSQGGTLCNSQISSRFHRFYGNKGNYIIEIAVQLISSNHFSRDTMSMFPISWGKGDQITVDSQNILHHDLDHPY